MHARNWHFFRHFLDDANPPYTAQEIERYVEAWSQPGAAAGMINYYRASVRQSQKEAAAKLRPISAPTLVIWGERDSYLGSDLAEPDRDDVPNLDRVERLADASHWVHHDEAERVNQLLIDFFAAARARGPHAAETWAMPCGRRAGHAWLSSPTEGAPLRPDRSHTRRDGQPRRDGAERFDPSAPRIE